MFTAQKLASIPEIGETVEVQSLDNGSGLYWTWFIYYYRKPYLADDLGNVILIENYKRTLT